MIRLVLLLVACASPCPDRNGSINGYCQGKIAVNCLQTCGDCTDSWVENTCATSCTVSDQKPASIPGGQPPAQKAPSKYAVCPEWSSTDGGI